MQNLHSDVVFKISMAEQMKKLREPAPHIANPLIVFLFLTTPLLASADGLRARNILPPGQSGHVSPVDESRAAPGRLQNILQDSFDNQSPQTSSGNPEDFGPHLDDQRQRYWSFQFKEGGFTPKCADPETPRPGVEICRTAEGVPVVFAGAEQNEQNQFDLWYGVGYAIAQDRLFLMDAVRRMGAGTFAELTGCAAVPGDIQQRILTYSDAEYAAMYERQSADAKASVDGYVAGANAWIQQVMQDPLNRLPVEYAVLSTYPEPLTRKDILAGGVLITRTVAAEGANEFQNVALLAALEARFGKQDGRRIFQDYIWQDDSKAVTTVPLDEGKFYNMGRDGDVDREAVFQTMADYSLTLPTDLAEGPGTGAAPDTCRTPPSNLSPQDALPGAFTGAQASPLQSAVDALIDFRENLRGGSFMVAIAPDKTRGDAEALLISAPQLGYTYPSLLVELEIHGAGIDARGSSVPGLPTVGIGYNNDIAWALTTGYSKTIDSFIEELDAVGGKNYRHNGETRAMDCRDEVIRYRHAESGLPASPALLEITHEVCRTVHGPVVSWSAEKPLARSVKYAMYNREIDTIEGIFRWNRARNFEDFVAGTRQVTWNENVGYAGADGHIAYFHPGIHWYRSLQSDQRLPKPGTGSHDDGAQIPFEELPHVIDPKQGFIANWNNKPAVGWLDGEGLGSPSRPGGNTQRVSILNKTIAEKDDWTFEDLIALDRTAGVTDPRALAWTEVMLSLQKQKDLDEKSKAALDAIAGWDQQHYANGLDINAPASEALDTVGATVFDYFLVAIRDALFGDIPEALRARQANGGSHVFDQTVEDNLALRILQPSSSTLSVRFDYLQGRTRAAVLREALSLAINRMAQDFASTNPADWRRPHPRSSICSLTGGIVGPCIDMPYQDRGSWIHHAGYPASPPAKGLANPPSTAQ